MGDLSKHFDSNEFKCRCCGMLHPDGVPSALVAELELIREHYGKPVHINSGYRCPDHNRACGGAMRSQHMAGQAADFWIKGVRPADVWFDLNQNHEGGLGKYKTFTHIDVRGYRARW
jgi:uncharacterized protein YcbK (DUF882 family)